VTTADFAPGIVAGQRRSWSPGLVGHTRFMLTTVNWLARFAVCVLIGILTFVTRPPTGADLVLQIVGFLACSAGVGFWLMVDVRPSATGARWLLPGMGVMAVVAGLLCMAPHGGAFVGFSVIAILATSTDPGWLAGWVIVALAVVSIEVGALIFSNDTDVVWSYPLLLGVAFIGGRNRRSYVAQARQSAAMLQQLQQLRVEQRRVDVLDERNRIAREIHDVLAHSLGALGIHLQLVRAVLEQGDSPRAQSLLEQAQRMATDGLVDTRRAVQALRGDATGLDDQLVELVATHRTRHRTVVELRVDGEPRALAPEATVALIRTAQEALVNTAKHAAHQPVAVSLTYAVDDVRLAVTNPLTGLDGADNDGADDDGSTAFSSVDGGYGLIGMRERLLLISGSLTTGYDGHGRWSVLAQVPR
jgi:signal transduction histidine kinase